MAPFTRKLLVLVGPPGVGRHAMVRKMVKYDPKIFETTKAGEYDKVDFMKPSV